MKDKLGHDWSIAPQNGCIGYTPYCFNCNVDADSEWANIKCGDVLEKQIKCSQKEFEEWKILKDKSERE